MFLDVLCLDVLCLDVGDFVVEATEQRIFCGGTTL